jgi:hypothetical protein
MRRTDLAGGQVGREDGLELIIVDLTGTSDVKDSESELVVCVGLLSVRPEAMTYSFQHWTSAQATYRRTQDVQVSKTTNSSKVIRPLFELSATRNTAVRALKHKTHK